MFRNSRFSQGWVVSPTTNLQPGEPETAFNLTATLWPSRISQSI
jgi:hypothetical protein